MYNVSRFLIVPSLALILLCTTFAQETQDKTALIAKRSAENQKLMQACPYTVLSRDFFSRFSYDPNAKPAGDEFAIDKDWKIILPANVSPLADLMTGHFIEFMAERMNVMLTSEKCTPADFKNKTDKVILFIDSEGGDPNTEESFTITSKPGQIKVAGHDPAGLRDGIVKLVDMIGFRQAPILKAHQQVYKPRIPLRIGQHGSFRDTVFMGYNAVRVSFADITALSDSNAIPELVPLRKPDMKKAISEQIKEASRYGLKTFLHLNRWIRYTKDDPIFKTYPDIRGAMTWAENGLYSLCPEHPLVKQYIDESTAGIFRNNPDLDGLVIIIGGEGFYHCFMRSYGSQRGHSNCPRCEALGAETAVSNMCNYMGQAARKVNPNAVVYAWPYSAYVWSADDAQVELIKKLKPGTGILSEIDKDEVMHKTDGIVKPVWDYGIDFVGPSDRAKKQIAACKAAGIPICLLSMAEETLEYTRQPHIPCMDRWADRAEALATCGLDSVYVWQMGPYDGTSAAEINKFLWWTPIPDREQIMQSFASRIAGKQAAPHVRNAWKFASEAMGFSPQVGAYYQGPHHLGPAHPMFIDPNYVVPDVFYGALGFFTEINPDETFKPRPLFFKSSTEMKSLPSEKLTNYEKNYRKMEELMKQASNEMNKAKLLVPNYCNLMFGAENSAVQWLYHTVRTEANFFESCRLHDKMLAFARLASMTPQQHDEAAQTYKQLHQLLLDEKANAIEALPILEADARLDWGGDFPHGIDMLRAKLEILDHDINDYLPSLAKRCKIEQK